MMNRKQRFQDILRLKLDKDDRNGMAFRKDGEVFTYAQIKEKYGSRLDNEFLFLIGEGYDIYSIDGKERLIDVFKFENNGKKENP